MEIPLARRKCKNIDHAFFLAHPVLKNHVSLLHSLKQSFKPDDDVWFVRAPGRVNLIGEHTDYNMGPVLPCAIDREVVFCLRKNQTGLVNVSNTLATYDRIQFPLHQPIEPYPRGNWGNYLKAGVNGLLEYFHAAEETIDSLCGYDAIVSSTLPVAAGISSSSALVVAAAFSLLLVNQIALDKMKLAEICAAAEHFVGTAGGGMDQAASLMGKKDSFLKIEFNPLRVQTVPSPEEIFLILFHSLVEAEKSLSVRKEYNRRVLECQISVELYRKFIASRLGRNFKPVNFIGEIKADHFNLSEKDLDCLVDEFLNQLKDFYKLEELAALFGVSKEELDKKYQGILKDDTYSEPAGGFKIKGRFRHVYTECRRVDEMIHCLHNKDVSGMGELLSASHESLSKNYEVSTPEVNDLINRLKSFDVQGARLMGAGFGGMILALTEKSHKDNLIKNMHESFYRQKVPGNINDYIIPCVPSDGADCI